MRGLYHIELLQWVYVPSAYLFVQPDRHAWYAKGRDDRTRAISDTIGDITCETRERRCTRTVAFNAYHSGMLYCTHITSHLHLHTRRHTGHLGFPALIAPES